MYCKAHVTYEVEEYEYGGQGFASTRKHIATFETKTEAECCALQWREDHPGSWAEPRIIEHINLLGPIIHA